MFLKRLAEIGGVEMLEELLKVVIIAVVTAVIDYLITEKQNKTVSILISRGSSDCCSFEFF